MLFFQASESEPPYEPLSQKSPLKKKKRKTLDLNRTVLLSQMKERVEAAFVAREQDQSDKNVPEVYNPNNHATSSTENEDVIAEDDENIDKPSEYSEPDQEIVEEKQEEKFIKNKNHHNVFDFATSEESSNDTDETGNDVKLKNVILRNCFASLHRRQQKEKEKEYDQYLNE